jgi:hypothetical protein
MIDRKERIKIYCRGAQAFSGELPLWGDMHDYVGVPFEAVLTVLLTQNQRLAGATDTLDERCNEAERYSDKIDDRCDDLGDRLDRLDE